ncbi:MAG: NAD(+) diphosphatase [Alphaproteobacteria bacterium]|nr:NAD(+) diphosphatase [Alphaproteobacteria bacterium]
MARTSARGSVAAMHRTNIYAAHGFDRATHRRRDGTWLAERLSHPSSIAVPVWNNRSLVRVSEQQALLSLPPDALLDRARHWVFLGEMDGRAVFAVDLLPLSDDEALDLAQSLAPGAQFEDLRKVGSTLPRLEAHLLAYARGLAHWHARHRFCGVCGSETEMQEAGHVRRCTNPACQTEHYPRTDPATIMLVTDGNRALLGHNKRFPPGPDGVRMFSTLAGFVEPGESLEDAVAREVLEEVGVTVGAVRYHSSQPWPFPQSLMIGFYAEATSTAITIDPDELADARWFTADEIRNPTPHGFALPRVDSIARALIEGWVATC